jgi:mevalonate kinase
MKSYYSNGKILLTGEYAVMFGAKSLAFPLVYGQDMIVETIDNRKIYWKAYNENELWFSATFSLPELTIDETSSPVKAQFLQQILRKLFELNDRLFNSGYSFKTNTNFPVNWGFGTSSTLIHNLALWAELDPYLFYYAVSKGSGYDIACAGSNSPILFQRKKVNPVIEPVGFQKSYISDLFLVYSGKKQETERHLTGFLQSVKKSYTETEEISEITNKIIQSDKLEEFIDLIKKHEEIISKMVQKRTLQNEQFPDFDGGVKSLGAWGGDFFLATSLKGKEYIQHYFEQLGFSVILPFRNTVLF